MKTPKIVEGILPTVNLNMVRLKNANSIRFDEGPMLETSPYKLFTMANLHHKLSW